MAEMKNEKILPPKPMTTDNLMAYLYNTADRAPIEDEFVLIDGEPVVNMTLKNGHITLYSRPLLEEGMVVKAPVTATMLTKYLELASVGIFHKTLDRPVMISDEPVVNATVIDHHVVLQTAELYFAQEEGERNG